MINYKKSIKCIKEKISEYSNIQCCFEQKWQLKASKYLISRHSQMFLIKAKATTIKKRPINGTDRNITNESIYMFSPNSWQIFTEHTLTKRSIFTNWCWNAGYPYGEHRNLTETQKPAYSLVIVQLAVWISRCKIFLSVSPALGISDFPIKIKK